MKTSILDGIKLAITEGGIVTVDITEASGLDGSGSAKGGRIDADSAFAALRSSNPLRQGARVAPLVGAELMMVAKRGNATGANPWTAAVNPNSGSPNVDTAFWQLPSRVISAQLPIRSAVLSDVNGLDAAIVDDLALEFSAIEGAGMVANNDQSGSVTTSTGAVEGLRGLDSYASGSASAYGSSGKAITDGVHTIATTSLGGATVTYNKMVAATASLPAPYWALPGTTWHISPAMVLTLRQLKDAQGMPLFLELGEKDGSSVGHVFGFPVVINPYLSDAFPIYLANWGRFLTISDSEQMTIQMFDQSAPGFVTLYAEKRVASAVRDPMAGVRVSAA